MKWGDGVRCSEVGWWVSGVVKWGCRFSLLCCYMQVLWHIQLNSKGDVSDVANGARFGARFLSVSVTT